MLRSPRDEHIDVQREIVHELMKSTMDDGIDMNVKRFEGFAGNKLSLKEFYNQHCQLVWLLEEKGVI